MIFYTYFYCVLTKMLQPMLIQQTEISSVLSAHVRMNRRLIIIFQQFSMRMPPDSGLDKVVFRLANRCIHAPGAQIYSNSSFERL